MKDQLQIPTKQKPNKCMLQLQFQISSPGRMLSSKVNLLPWNMQLGSIHAVLKHMWAYLFYILVNFTSDELSGTNNMCVGMVNGYIEAKCLQHNELKIILATWLYKLLEFITSCSTSSSTLFLYSSELVSGFGILWPLLVILSRTSITCFSHGWLYDYRHWWFMTHNLWVIKYDSLNHIIL